MSELEDLETREFSSVDARRAAIMVGILLAFGVISWFILSGVQSLLIPAVANGNAELWVIRPHRAFHFGAAVVMAIPLILMADPWLQRWWAKEDLALGSRFRPYHGKPRLSSRFFAKTLLLLVAYTHPSLK